jgi:phasin family protein
MANNDPKPQRVKSAAKPASRGHRAATEGAPSGVATSPVAPRRTAPSRPAPKASPQRAEAAAPAEATLTKPTIEAAAAAIQPATSQAEGRDIMDDNAKKTADTVKAGADKAHTLFVEFNDRAKAAMEKGSKMFEEMNDFAKGNVEAMVESSRIAAKGIESMGQEAAEYSRKSFEGATAAMKQFATIKSPTDLFKLQSDYMRSAFDSLVAETSKNTEAMLKLAGDIAQPLSNRAAVAAEKIKIAA